MNKATNKEHDMTRHHTEIARTIFKQLGNATFALIGAKDFLAYTADDCKEGYLGGLRFRIGKNPEGVTHVFIALHASDTYTVTFSHYNRRTFEETILFVDEGVYVDSLHDRIEARTALYTRF